MGQTLTGGSLEDKYFLQKIKLGEGSFGVVWRATERQSNAIVAIKQVDKKKMTARGMAREDVMREISMMKACKHINVIELYDTFEDDTLISLALEYCDGGDFGDKVKEKAANLQEREAAEWTRQICSAIAALHSNEICHRDIKPDNFMVSGEQLKLCDFGLAIRPSHNERLRVRCGTPAFMAPEQLKLPNSSNGYSYEVDIWAAGIILYMLVSGGKHPFIRGKEFEEKKCLEGQLDFSGPESEGLNYLMGRTQRFSEAPRSLARRMVDPNHNTRITARAALEERWLVNTWQGKAVAQASPSNNVFPAAAAAAGGAAVPFVLDGLPARAPDAAAPGAGAAGPSSAATVPFVLHGLPPRAPHAAVAPAPTPGAFATLAAAALIAPIAIAAYSASADGRGGGAPARGFPADDVVPARSGYAEMNPAPKRHAELPSTAESRASRGAPVVSSPTYTSGAGTPAHGGTFAAAAAPSSRIPLPVKDLRSDVAAKSHAAEPRPDTGLQRPVEVSGRVKAAHVSAEDLKTTIVMVGPTGQGKSTLGNMIAGGGKAYMPFKTSDDFDSETLDCAHADFAFEQRAHRAIDTIGFLDTRMSATENMDKFACFADRAPGGIDAFIFVLKKGRFTEQSLGQLLAFRSVAGESALRHVILVFTHCGEETSEALSARCLSSANPHLKTAVDSCASVIGVDSLAIHRCEDDRINLFNGIADLIRANNGVKYDNATLTEARQRRVALAERIQGLAAERRDAMKDRMDALFNGRLTFEQVAQALEDAVEAEERERKAADERVSLQALLAAAKSEASAWKEVARNALRSAAGGETGSALGLAGCCAPMPAMDMPM